MNTADYGPVTLQFVFKLAALVLLVRFHQNASKPALAGAFFLLGLGLWDKAVFAWVLFGLAAAAVAVFPRDLRKHLSGANIAVAGLAMLAGALPLVIYNIARPLETLRSNAHLGQIELLHKPTPRTNHGRPCDVRIPDGRRTGAAARPAEPLVPVAVARGQPLDRPSASQRHAGGGDRVGAVAGVF